MSNSKFFSLYTLSLPFALAICIPLAFFAVITTIIASSILAVRVFLVYLELVFAVIFQYLLPSDTTRTTLSRRHSSHNVTFNTSRSPTPPIRRRSRRLSNASLTPAASSVSLPVPRSIGSARDFEGVGGWRLDGPSEDDDHAWTNINSRLELPAESPRRHHRRRLTNDYFIGERIEERTSPDLVIGRGGGGGGWSPNTKRLRTPTLITGGAGAMDSYFAIGWSGNGGNGNGNWNGNGGSPKLSTRVPSAVSTTSGSPVSSKSSGLTMNGRQ